MALVRVAWLRWSWLLVLPCASAEDLAQDQLEADAEFLEYLGTWQDGDADWIAVAEWEETDEPEAAVERERQVDEQGG